ncbi:UNVERIFIED_CONTAM: cation:H+ antiporter [Acetivibrio alkalicellulosi]
MIWFNIIWIAISLILILISCELFTNGIEWLGKNLKLGDGAVGSIFSAVGTCIPETMVPIITILFLKENKESIDMGIAAILGAPFMLSTLAFFVTGISVFIFWFKRKTGMRMSVNNSIISRDISCFIIAYTLGILASFVKWYVVRRGIAIFLIILYIYYIMITLKEDRITMDRLNKLYMEKILNIKNNIYTILLQVVIAVLGIILGAHMFVSSIEDTSKTLGISIFVFSLIVTPIVTELPEKFNSIIWISKKKDTLAIGNITGAMVFQSCIPVSLGILATPWKLNHNIVTCAVMAVLSSAIIYFWIEHKKKLSPVPLVLGGVFYTIFIISLF